MRMKKGKLGWTPRVFASLRDGSKIRNAQIASTALATKTRVAMPPHPANVRTTPAEFNASALKSTQGYFGSRPRNTGIHLALNPQTNGTKNPQAISTRYRWSKTWEKAGSEPCSETSKHPARFTASASNRPVLALITTQTQGSNRFLPAPRGRCCETV